MKSHAGPVYFVFIAGGNMNRRINYNEHSQPMIQKLLELAQLCAQSSLGPTISDLIHIRASQMNGCAFCLDMHVKEAKIHGERELRLYHVPIWRESTLFSARERAALAWTEALTHIAPTGVSDELYDELREQFSEKELSALT